MIEDFKTRFSQLEAVVFDLDDTLYDRNSFEHGAYKEISNQLEKQNNINANLLFKALKETQKKKYSNYQNLFKESLETINNYDFSLVSKCLNIYRAYNPKKLELYNGVKKTLDKIKAIYKIGIITNGRNETQIKKINALGLNSYFDYIIFPDLLGSNKKYNKPHTKPYETMANLLNIETKKMCYIGDNPNIDFIGAIKLDITCIRVLTGEYKDVMIKDKRNIYEFSTIESIF